MKVGARIELHPSLDRWMRGDRFGTIVIVLEDGRADVKMDKSGQTTRVSPANMTLTGDQVCSHGNVVPDPDCGCGT